MADPQDDPRKILLSASVAEVAIRRLTDAEYKSRSDAMAAVLVRQELKKALAVAETPAPQQLPPGARIDELTVERNLFKGKYRSIVALMDDTRQRVQEIVDHIDDEGDRVYFGSSNHADWLRDLVDDMDGWSFDAMLPKGDINKMERDPYAEIREQRSRANRAQAALKDAISHIEHMAAFIGAKHLGYSFESLGEDMPGMKDALATEGSANG